jgi:hypothetical protein
VPTMRLDVRAWTALASLVLVGAGCGSDQDSRYHGRLEETSDAWEVAMPQRRGESAFAGWPLTVTPGSVVRVTDARFENVDDGLEITRIWAIRNTRWSASIGTAYDVDRSLLHPITDAVIDEAEEWYLLVEYQAAEDGEYEASGLVVDYESGGRVRDARYQFTIVLKVPGACGLPPDCTG